MFVTPMTIEAFQEYQLLMHIQGTVQIQDTPDIWRFGQSSNPCSVSKIYRVMFPQGCIHPIYKHIWDNGCVLKYRIFTWLLIQERINTKNLLSRKSFHVPSIACVLCNYHIEETSLHLFWDCDFSLDCWESICPNRKRGISTIDNYMLLLDHLDCPIAKEIIGLWHIWMQRNNMIFNNKRHSIALWRELLKKDMILLAYRIKEKHKIYLHTWIDTHLN